ncbi:MAG: NAD-binding protein [Endomicrobium sp.]|nr:NAD-binding protein [Endomicrobium sp.]
MLLTAGVKSANYLIITIPSFNITLETASLASSLNQKTRILARARFPLEGKGQFNTSRRLGSGF